MDCNHARELLDEALDAGAPMPQEARAHLDQCADCRQWVETWQEVECRLRHEIQALPPVPAGLAQRVAAGAVAAPQPVRRTMRPAVWLSVAAAAAAALALSVAAYLQAAPRAEPEPDLAAADAARAAAYLQDMTDLRHELTSVVLMLPGEKPEAVAKATQPYEEEWQRLQDEARSWQGFFLDLVPHRPL